MNQILKKKLDLLAVDMTRISKQRQMGDDAIMFRLERLADRIDRIVDGLYAAKQGKGAGSEISQ